MQHPQESPATIRLEDCAPALARLVRHSPTDLDAFIVQVGDRVELDGTGTRVRCNFIASKDDGTIRVKDFARKLALQVVDYAVPRREIHKAIAHCQATNSTEKLIALNSIARSLFTLSETSGEGGELILYLLCETVLQLPQVICKMPLKTSNKMHYHGIDGVHAAVDAATGRLALYWGESKLHRKCTTAIDECFKSIAPFLLDDGGSAAAQERDLQLIRDNIDLQDPALEAAFLRYLDPDDPAFLKLEFRAACLVGFDLTPYGPPFTDAEKKAISEEVQACINKWHQRLHTAVSSAKLDRFHIEVFCLPFPSVIEFRKAFKQELGAA
jgi:hypothetical protein